MLGGLRHLIWDTGVGFDREKRLSMARMTLIGSVALTIIIWAVALLVR
jgi:succinate dehydrogenase / fumarate reductase cytochrome b subunit